MYKLSGKLKKIKVDFDSTVKSNHFNQNAFDLIKNNGLYLTDLSLIHYASIHYQIFSM